MPSISRKKDMHHMLSTPVSRNTSRLLMVGAVICIIATAVYAQGNIQRSGGDEIATATAQHSLPTTSLFQPVRTDSPRETFRTFLRLTREFEDALMAYQEDQSRANARQLKLLGPRFHQLFDLSSVPMVSRRRIGTDTFAFLLDIIGRIDLPPIESIPDINAFDDDETLAIWRVPHTPIKIVRIEEGPREGEFLFSARTVTVAPTFYRQVQNLPLRSSLEIESWSRTLPQLHGPMIPSGLVSVLPDSLKRIWFDTPIWKVLLVAILGALATLLLVLWHRVINVRASENRISVRCRHALTPVAIIVVVMTLRSFVAFEVNVVGTFAQSVFFAATLVIYLAVVWIFWLVVLTLFEWIISSPKIPDESLDANLLRLCARVVGFVGGAWILVYGAQDLGLSVFGLLAGLGVGGLAVALAIRPTLENLIGGAILYMDRPVRVGDFCTFGTHTGTIESIGLRSTQVRALDRTLISVPNATFVDMEIINWAKCDRMLILATIGLRYETEPDQLRYVLAMLREMFHAHPKIDRTTVRVRFAEYGASSLDVEIRVYALTREWNEFYAIREDVFLRVNEIVGNSGSGFAFPSQTLYWGRDDGLDKERSSEAMQQVKSWRKSGQLPFPQLAASRIEQLADTLDYPPRGSPGADPSGAAVTEAAESLSAEPQLEDTDSAKQHTDPERR